MFKRKFLPVLISIFLLNSLVPIISSASEVESKSIDIELKKQEIDTKIFNQSEIILKAIEDIPNYIVKQGPQETAKWLETTTGYPVSIDNNENLIFNKQRVKRSWGCAGAVGVALVSNGLPFSKIFKVKSALKALGGTNAAISKIKKSYDSYRYNGFARSDSIRKALNSVADGFAANTKASLLDFFNLTNVIANCF
ncbi:hypothetical protein [Bacillus mycoides]|uniref:hypothetical protein n=1 Tax=Bacillus mycoides TaxID=1405 RepID=UPI003D64AC27